MQANHGCVLTTDIRMNIVYIVVIIIRIVIYSVETRYALSVMFP